MVSSSKEISFRWFAFLQSARDEVEVDGFGFLKAKNHVSSIVPGFDEAWSDAFSIMSKTSNENNSPPWFFEVDDSDAQTYPSDKDLEPTEEWTKNDNALLETLLKDCGLDLLDGNVNVESIPDLNWSMSFEEVSWDEQLSPFPLKSCRQETHEFRWDEAKFCDLDGILSAASTESGSNVTDPYYEDDLSALTHATGLTTVETSTESVASEQTNDWYRAKIASLFTSKKKSIIAMRPEELEVWPTKQTEPVPCTSDLEAPLLVTLSPEELTRHMYVMQEREEKQAQIEHFVKSNDPIVRQYAQDQLK
jgi:hypothetical protein